MWNQIRNFERSMVYVKTAKRPMSFWKIWPWWPLTFFWFCVTNESSADGDKGATYIELVLRFLVRF